MTTNERIAVACGWKMHDHPDCMELKKGWSIPEAWCLNPLGVLCFKHDVPAYDQSLDAMAEAEKAVLTYEQQPVFLAVLKRILMTPAGVSDWDVLHASPAQRADALLKVLDATQTPPRP